MARFDGGWIKGHRGILENVVSKRDIFTFGVFMRLLFMANWKESKVIFNGQKVTLKPGQLVTGLRELSPFEEEDEYLHKIRNALSYLVLCEAIQQATSNQGRLITICNWEKYQCDEKICASDIPLHQQAERKQGASDAQLSEEDKKERRIQSEPKFDFEALFRKYGEKQGKAEGLKRCALQIKTQEDYEALSKAIDRYTAHCLKSNQFLKHFSSFLGTKRSGYPWRDWLDDEVGQSLLPFKTSNAEKPRDWQNLKTLEDLKRETDEK